VFAPEAAVPVKAVVAGVVSAEAPAIEGAGEFTLLPYASSLLYDGRGTNKPWLLETPDPVTKITWHAWVELHPDAAATDVKEGRSSRRVRAGASRRHASAGLRPDVVAVPMGFGHRMAVREGPGCQLLDLLGHVGRVRAVSRHEGLIERAAGVPEGRGPRNTLSSAIAEACRWRSRRKASRSRRRRGGGPSRHEINTGPRSGAAGWRDGGGSRGRQDPYRYPVSTDVRHDHRPREVHRLPGLRHRLLRREQHPDRGRAGDPQGPGDDLDPDRALLGGRGGRAVGVGRYVLCLAPSRCVPCTRITRPTGSTARSTTAAWARATAPTTAPTRCGTSTGTSTTRSPGRSRCTCSSIRTSPCVRAA
jgi:hypothetical protein